MDSVEDGGRVECQPLIDVLIDSAARWDERDDAATDLGDFDEPEALEALLRVARDFSEDETLLETVGDAIGEILIRHPERVDRTKGLTAVAQRALSKRFSMD